MGFSSGSMNIVIKNNRDLLRKRKHFVKPLGVNSSDSKTEYDLPEATPRVLNNIRERLQFESRQRFIKIILVFGLVMSSLIFVFLTYI